MLSQLLERRKVSVYQDVVLDGQTIRKGRRDCEGRWRAIAPHLPSSGAMLDVGSNFGWFGLRACETWPRLVIASVEADEESARIQRHVLASHRHPRIVLLTRRAGAAMARDFAAARQRFDAVLCLSVLHWMPDHEQFLRIIGAISPNIFVELPDPFEAGAGVSDIRRQVGPAGDYLRRLFPERRCVRLAQSASHRDTARPREIWLAAQTGNQMPCSAGLDVSAVLQSSPSWPPQSWWRRQLDQIGPGPFGRAAARLVISPDGLTWSAPADGRTPPSLAHVERQIAALPEKQLLSRRDWLARRIRGLGKSVLQRVRRFALLRTRVGQHDR